LAAVLATATLPKCCCSQKNTEGFKLIWTKSSLELIDPCWANLAYIQVFQYQIKSNQSSFIWWKKAPRLSQTQRWFTEYYQLANAWIGIPIPISSNAL